MFDHDDAEDGFDHDDAEDGRRVILLRRGVDYLVPTLPPTHVASLLLFFELSQKEDRKKV